MRNEVRRSLFLGVALTVTAASLAVGLAVGLGWLRPSPNAIRSILHPPGTAEIAQASASSTQGAPLDFAFPDQPRLAPDLQFVDASGQSHSLAEFRGRPVVLNIWATWCVPCRKEMPALDRLQAMFAGSDLLVLALSIDRQGPSVVTSFYQEIGVSSLGIYVDASGSATRRVGAVGIPTTLLIDRAGREIGRKIGAAEWDSAEIVTLIRDRLEPRPAAQREGRQG